MSSLNQVLLIGNLGKDPELIKETKSGYFVRLSIATTKTLNVKSEIIKKTYWHTVYLSNSLGKSAMTYFKKGHKVFIRGELEKRDYKDKEGNKCYETAVWAKECFTLNRSKPNGEVISPEESHPEEVVAV